MSTKIAKNSYPTGHTAHNFQCFGPPATKDTEFNNCKIADMGCFTQDGKDSNKYYHVAIVKSKINNLFYIYVEYGRQGAGKPQYQFVECNSESEAQVEFVKKCQEKNTKRGQWEIVGTSKMFVPKKGQDMYSVRQLAKRTHGLPDSQTITIVQENIVKKVKSVKSRCDIQTTQLMRDLLGGAVTYTRSSLQGGTIPVQSAIDEARDILTHAKQRIGAIGHDLNIQVQDADLKKITYALYSRIPKIKPLHSPERDWILSQDNIFNWEQDLDAFETALQNSSIEDIQDDPMQGLPFDMSWIDPKTEIGTWLYRWWPNASQNRHSYLNNMKIKGLWRVNRHNDDTTFIKNVKEIDKKSIQVIERPLHQQKTRIDLNPELNQLYWNNNVAMMFHGTRSVNVPGILKNNLKLPKQLKGVHITAAMFGDGIYWADDWRKSAGYTSLGKSLYSHGAGAVANRSAFMFVADVLLGKAYVAPKSYGYVNPPKGYDSIFGKGGYSVSTYTNKALLNNEWIVYEGGRNLLKYLVEFEA